MKPKDFEEFLTNLREYIDQRHKGDNELARIYNHRMRKFLEADLAGLDTEKPEDNPFRHIVVLSLICDMEGDPDRLGKIRQLSHRLKTHWESVRGTPDGDKLPMINFMRQVVHEIGLPDKGAVETRMMVEASGLFNGSDGPKFPPLFGDLP
jgi:hypothetical protein